LALLERVQAMVLPRNLFDLCDSAHEVGDFTRKYALACLKLVEFNRRLSNEAVSLRGHDGRIDDFLAGTALMGRSVTSFGVPSVMSASESLTD
jgi:hypothetical protein